MQERISEKQEPENWWWPEGVVFEGKKDPNPPIFIEEQKTLSRLSPYVQCYWDMRWELGEERLSCLCVPSACINLVFHVQPEPQNLKVYPPQPLIRSKIIGVRTVASTIDMCGTGNSFGLRFSPGGFYEFCQKDAAYFTDKIFPLNEVFGEYSTRMETIAVSKNNLQNKARELEKILNLFVPDRPKDEFLAFHQKMQRISNDSSIKNTLSLTRALGMTERSLQRLFAKYTGITPTMWIRTKRFQHAAKEVIAGKVLDWSELAVELGYYDQSHFINDFKNMTGRRPSELVAGCQTFCRPFTIQENQAADI